MKKLAVLFLLAIIFSCDTIDTDDIYETNDENKTSDIVSDRKVVLMEMTAIYCANCPPASAEAQRIIDFYNGNVIGINIHASNLANPQTSFDPFFRNDDSDELYAVAGFPPLPVGFMNYYADAINNESGFSGWEGILVEEILKEPNMIITLEPKLENGLYKVEYQINYIDNQLETEKLAIFVVEDGIIGTQKNGTQTIESYEHNHVSRGSVTGIGGITLFQENALQAGESASGTVDISIANDWITENIKLVAFIFDENTNYIYQAEQVSLIK